jgi:tetratricopeptide (TPR) repeat protein
VHRAHKGVNCPNCGAPLTPEGDCGSCGATVRGFYGNLDLGKVDIASAVEQGLDYYLLLGVKVDARDVTIQAAYTRLRDHFPPDTSNLVPQMAQRLELLEQAGYVLCDPQRRQTYDALRLARQARQARPESEAARGLACFRTRRFNDAARLLRAAIRKAPLDEDLHIHYVLSLIYGCEHLASPEDWRVDEMINAMNQIIQSGQSNSTAHAYMTLCHAINHYDKGRFAEAWELMAELTAAMPRWHLPWIISAYWSRREGDLPQVLVRAERARRVQADDHLLHELVTLMRRVWATSADLLPAAARRAVLVLADGTAPAEIEAFWREPQR